MFGIWQNTARLITRTRNPLKKGGSMKYKKVGENKYKRVRSVLTGLIVALIPVLLVVLATLINYIIILTR